MYTGPRIEQLVDDNPPVDEVQNITGALNELTLGDSLKKSLFSQLLAATENQDIDSFDRLISLPAIRYVVAVDDNLPLRWAAYHNNFDMVRSLLVFQEVLENLRSSADLILTWAVRRQDRNMVKYLCQYPAFLDVVATDNNRPLFWAIYNSDVDMVNFLLSFPAVSDGVAAPDRYFLEYAMFKGNLDVVTCLLACQAIQRKLVFNGHDVLAAAAETGRVALLEKLLKIPAVSRMISFRDNYVLNVLAEFGHIDAFNLLLEHQEIRESLSINWHSTLRLAAEKGHIKVVQRLIQFGGDAFSTKLAHDFPAVYNQVQNKRLATACATLLLNKLVSSKGQKLPKGIQHHILFFYAHKRACGQRHEPVEHRAGTSFIRCKETAKFILNALREREAQNSSLLLKIKKFFRCGR